MGRVCAVGGGAQLPEGQDGPTELRSPPGRAQCLPVVLKARVASDPVPTETTAACVAAAIYSPEFPLALGTCPFTLVFRQCGCMYMPPSPPPTSPSCAPATSVTIW